MGGKIVSGIQTGARFGEWVVIGESRKIHNDYHCPCLCVCGKQKMVPVTKLENGSSRNCGCMKNTRKFIEMNVCTSPENRETFRLIALGVLPPADQINRLDGSPAWSLSSISGILGLDPQEFLSRLRQDPRHIGTRHKQASGAEHRVLS